MKEMDLGSFSIEVKYREDGLYDIYAGHEGCSPDHHTGLTIQRVGEVVADLVDCIREGYGDVLEECEEKDGDDE